MHLEIEPNDTFNEEELRLIEKAKIACSKIHYAFFGQRIDALIHKPCSIDFKAHKPGQIGQAFVGPMTELTDDLFNGDGFTSDMISKIDSNVKDYYEYVKSTT